MTMYAGGAYNPAMFDGVMKEQRAYADSAAAFDSVVAENRAADPTFMTPAAATYDQTGALAFVILTVPAAEQIGTHFLCEVYPG